MYEVESSVRSYCRKFSDEFASANGTVLKTTTGKQYLDFLCGCGSLNYGHNDPDLKDALLQYVANDGLAMSLDLHSTAKMDFLARFENHILSKRLPGFKVQFTGPTGTNAVEAAIKLARKVTGRHTIASFTRGFHGCTLGALALTGNQHHRGGSEGLLHNVLRLPYEGYLGQDFNSVEMLETLIDDPSSGIDLPAAVILETVQGEGGLNCASGPWLRALQDLCNRYEILLIIDDIQAGCGRTNRFFSFEPFDIQPDMVVVAKGISGFGLPMSLVLFRPELDQWKPGEHNGTFRGNNLAFVTASTALEKYWATDQFQGAVKHKSKRLVAGLEDISHLNGFTIKGRGMMLGLDLLSSEVAASCQRSCVQNGLILETCGPHDEILKLLPPLTVSNAEIDQALSIIQDAVITATKQRQPTSTAAE